MKKCHTCKFELEDSEFGEENVSCKDCHDAYNRLSRQALKAIGDWEIEPIQPINGDEMKWYYPD